MSTDIPRPKATSQTFRNHAAETRRRQQALRDEASAFLREGLADRYPLIWSGIIGRYLQLEGDARTQDKLADSLAYLEQRAGDTPS